MSTMDVQPPAAVDVTSPRALARRIASSDVPVVVVDVRDPADFAAWRIEAPGVPLDVRNLPLDTAMRRLDALASGLPPAADVVVTGYAGGGADAVAEGLARRGVAASVLAGGMTAWGRLLRPVRVRLSIPGVKVVQVQRVARGCLSHLVVCGPEALVIDPGADVSGYESLAARYGARVVAVFDTHLHGDHVSGARALAAAAGAELLLPAATLERRIAFAGQVSAIADGDVVRVGETELRVVALPGHTADMTGLLLGSSILFAGDSIGAGGPARVEADGGEARELALQLHRTLHERVFALGPRARLLPGHYAGGVRRAPVCPTVAAARAAAPEAELPGASFAERAAREPPQHLARARRIAEVNAGRAEPDTELEAGGVALAG